MAVLTFPSILPATVDWWLETRTQTFVSPLSGSVQTLELPGAARWACRLSFPDRNSADGRLLMGFLASLGGMAGRFYLQNFAFPTPAGAASGSPSAGAVYGASATATSVEPIGETSIALTAPTRAFQTGEYIKFANHDDVYEILSGGNPLTIEAGGLTTEVPSTTAIAIYVQGNTIKTDGWGNNTLIFKAGDYLEINDELKIITEDITSDGSGFADLPIAPTWRSTVPNNDVINVDNPKGIFMLSDDKQTRGSYRKTSISNVTINIIEAFS